MGWLPGFQREWRFHRLPALGIAGAPLLGLAFGVGWTPCTGPTLGVVLGLAGDPNTATAGRGALLTAVYCMGLGLPFILAGLAFRKALGAFDVVKRHYAFVVRGGGLLLVAVGVLLVTGEWNTISSHLRNADRFTERTPQPRRDDRDRDVDRDEQRRAHPALDRAGAGPSVAPLAASVRRAPVLAAADQHAYGVAVADLARACRDPRAPSSRRAASTR